METNEMSSGSQTEQDLAQEALDATSTEEAEEKTSPAGEAEPTVPLHEHTALRTRAQTAEVAAARAEGKLEALQAQNVATATVSPLDAEIARQVAEGIAEEDMHIPPSVYRADKLYERNQAAQLVEAETTRQLDVQQTTSLNAAKLVHDDYEDVIVVGRALLSPGEKLDVNSAGANFGEFAYAKCKAAIERNKPVKETEAAPETELSKSEAEAKAKADAEAKVKAEELKSQEDLLKNKVLSDNPAIAAAMKL